jgi:hypothetical protein
MPRSSATEEGAMAAPDNPEGRKRNEGYEPPRVEDVSTEDTPAVTAPGDDFTPGGDETDISQ